MRAKKTGLALLLVMALGLGGCAQGVQERPAADFDPSSILPGREAPLADGAVPEEKRQMLFFVSRDGERLLPAPRTQSVPGFGREADALLSALLAGPEEGETDLFWPAEGLPAEDASVQTSGTFAAVDLPVRYRQLDPQTLYAVRRAAAETFFAAGMRAVQVLVGGREEGVDLGGTMPAGTFLPESAGNLSAQLAQMEDERQSKASFSRWLTLYLPSADGVYLLPALRSVRCESASSVACLYAALDELGRTPDAELVSSSYPAPLDYMEEMPEVGRASDGVSRVVRLHFTETLRAALREGNLPETLYLGMIVRTLMGFVPGVDGVTVRIGEEDVTALREGQPDELRFADGILTARPFYDLLGDAATIYNRGREPGKLAPKRVLLPAGENENPRLLWERMLAQPDGARALPADAGAFDLLAVRREREYMVMSFTERFYDQLSAMTETEAAQAVYALTMTMTEGNALRGCVFFFGGEQKDGVGRLVLRGRMMRDPGRVEE